MAKVTPPNYDFSLDQLKVYYPGNDLNKTKLINKKFTKISEVDGLVLTRFNILHVRYVFAVYVQSKSGKIIDFYTRLPTYFLHDLFHQSLINRFGKQDIYKRHEKQAVYIWSNKNKMKITYTSACTITCFPQYLSFAIIGNKQDKSFLLKMSENLLKTNSID